MGGAGKSTAATLVHASLEKGAPLLFFSFSSSPPLVSSPSRLVPWLLPPPLPPPGTVTLGVNPGPNRLGLASCRYGGCYQNAKRGEKGNPQLVPGEFCSSTRGMLSPGSFPRCPAQIRGHFHATLDPLGITVTKVDPMEILLTSHNLGKGRMTLSVLALSPPRSHHSFLVESCLVSVYNF